MPEHRIEKIDESHDRLILEFASTTLEQGYQRIFPDPMPKTHELSYRWESFDPKRPMRLVLEAAPRNSVVGPASNVPVSAVAEMEKLKEADLETLAAERSVPIRDAKGKKLSRAQLIAELAAK